MMLLGTLASCRLCFCPLRRGTPRGYPLCALPRIAQGKTGPLGEPTNLLSHIQTGSHVTPQGSLLVCLARETSRVLGEPSSLVTQCHRVLLCLLLLFTHGVLYLSGHRIQRCQG